MKLHNKYQRHGPSSFRQRNVFTVFPYIYIYITPTTGPFLPQGYNLNNLGRSLLDKTRY